GRCVLELDITDGITDHGSDPWQDRGYGAGISSRRRLDHNSFLAHGRAKALDRSAASNVTIRTMDNGENVSCPLCQSKVSKPLVRSWKDYRLYDCPACAIGFC